MQIEIVTITQFPTDRLSALSLREEAAGGDLCEAYRVELAGQAQAVEVLLFPGIGRAGVWLGGNAEWVDVDASGRAAVEQAVERATEGGWT